MIWHFWHCDQDYGQRLAQGVGVDIEKAKALPPLPNRPAPGEDRPASTTVDGQQEPAQKTTPTQPSVTA
jgi:catalase